MRACSACRRASARAGENALVSRRKYASRPEVKSAQINTVRAICAGTSAPAAIRGGVIGAREQHGEQCHRDAARPIGRPRRQWRQRGEARNFQQQQRLEKRGGLNEAVERLRKFRRGEQRTGQRQRIYGDQHARDHAQIAKIRQHVRKNVLPYTGHG